MRGFTLLELLVTVGVSSLVGFLLVLILIQNNRLFTSQSNKITHGLKLIDAQKIISNDIKGSSGVVSSYPSPSPNYFSSNSSLVLAVPAVDSSGNTITSVYDYFIFSKDPSYNNVLRKLVFKDPLSTRNNESMVLLTNLDKINFTYLDKSGNSVSPTTASKINFYINVKSTSGLINQVSSSSGEAILRNL